MQEVPGSIPGAAPWFMHLYLLHLAHKGSDTSDHSCDPGYIDSETWRFPQESSQNARTPCSPCDSSIAASLAFSGHVDIQGLSGNSFCAIGGTHRASVERQFGTLCFSMECRSLSGSQPSVASGDVLSSSLTFHWELCSAFASEPRCAGHARSVVAALELSGRTHGR